MPGMKQSPRRFVITVHTRSPREYVRETDSSSLAVGVPSAPVKGKANAQVIALLSRYFGIPKSRIVIVSGLTSKRKMIEIM